MRRDHSLEERICRIVLVNFPIELCFGAEVEEPANPQIGGSQIVIPDPAEVHFRVGNAELFGRAPTIRSINGIAQFVAEIHGLANIPE